MPARYSLARLLSAQGGAMRRHEGFPRLVSLLGGSLKLQRLSLSRTAYALLNGPRLELRNLGNFYATYRVPESPFFPLFLAMKWGQQRKRAAAKEEREKYISSVMASYPAEALALIGYAAAAERSRNPDCPVWKEKLRPRTKKRARELAALGLDEWLRLLAAYFDELKGAYRRIDLPETEALIACALLGCLPDPESGRLPTRSALAAAFRTASKTSHPDLGGDARRFRLVAEARELLLTPRSSGRRGPGRPGRGPA
jgi:hypothetical protein